MLKIFVKVFISIFLFLLISFSKSIGQDKTRPIEVQKYEDYLDSLAERPNPKSKVELTDQQAKHIARMMYEAHEKDTKEIYGFIRKRIDEKKLNKGLSKPTPNIIVGMLEKKLENSLTNNQKALIGDPWLLEITINSIEDSIHTVEADGTIVGLVNIHATVEDAIKGEIYKNRNSIKFYYIKGWPNIPEFIKGGTYLLFLSFKKPKNGIELIAFTGTTNWGIHSAQLPIVNGNVYDEKNEWGYGQQVTYEQFKSKLIEEIKTIKTW
jgi:hypothetical protein